MNDNEKFDIIVGSPIVNKVPVSSIKEEIFEHLQKTSEFIGEIVSLIPQRDESCANELLDTIQDVRNELNACAIFLRL